LFFFLRLNLLNLIGFSQPRLPDLINYLRIYEGLLDAHARSSEEFYYIPID